MWHLNKLPCMDPKKIENPPCRTIQQQRSLPLKVHFVIPKTYIQMIMNGSREEKGITEWITSMSCCAFPLLTQHLGDSYSSLLSQNSSNKLQLLVNVLTEQHRKLHIDYHVDFQNRFVSWEASKVIEGGHCCVEVWPSRYMNNLCHSQKCKCTR